jgi:hypothetical protein
MWMRVRLMGLAGAALVGLALATAVPAQADVMDCFEVVAPPELKQAVEDAAKAAQCVSQAAAGDAAMIATIGAITALRAGGAFSTTGECMGMIDSTIGKQVAKAVLASPAAPLFAPVKSQLQAMADGNSSVSFTDLASQFEPIALLLNYMTCGCQIAGLDNKVEEIVNAYVGHVTGCGEFLTDAANFAGEVIESGIDAAGEVIKVLGVAVGGLVEGAVDAVLSCFGFCDDDGPDCAPNTAITPDVLQGKWTDHTIYSHATGCGHWFCAEGSILKTKPGPGDKTLYTCSHCNGVWALNDTGTCAPCGGLLSKTIGADKTGAANMCLIAVTGYPSDDGAHCTKVESPPTCCAPGQVMKPVGWKGQVNCDPAQTIIYGQCMNVEKATAHCAPACPQPQYFDTATGKCTKCDFDSVPVYASADSSIAQCKQCPLGLNGFGQNCEPCGPGQVVWTLSPPKKQQKQLGPMAAIPPKKEQGRGTQKQVGPVAAKPPLDVITKPPPAPAPGTTMTEIPGGSMGGLVEGGRCMACPANFYPVYYFDQDKSSLGYCKECDPGTYLEVPKLSEVPPKDPKTGKWLSKPKQPQCVPLDCKAGLDPHNSHACRPPPEVLRPVIPVIPGGPGRKGCPPGMRLVDGACLPPTSTLVPGRRLACPPGYLPNAARTACIRIGRTPPGGVVTRVPSGPVAVPGKRRPPPLIFKPPILPPPRPIPIPR